MTTFSSTYNLATEEGHTYTRTHRISGNVVRSLLSFEGSRLEELAAESPSKRAGKALVRQGALRVTQVALQEGAELSWHEIPGPASIQVLRGRLQLSTAAGKMQLTPGAIVGVDSGVQHSALALSHCVLLMTISMPEGDRQ